METFFVAIVVLANISMTAALFALLLAVCIGFIALLAWWVFTLLWRPSGPAPKLERMGDNPVLAPDASHWWESQAVFNPGALVDDGKVHLFYRALGHDGVSRIGYAWSPDGIHFQRLSQPVYDWSPDFMARARKITYRMLSYNTDLYASGGGWGGCEDPRAVALDDRIYMTFGVFESWQSMRMAVTSLSRENFRAKEWQWMPHIALSPKGETHKNWVLFPEKINGRYAVLHALTPTILIDYVDSLEDFREKSITSNNNRSGRPGAWDAFVRGAAAPPLKTSAGWLLLYHGMNPAESSVGYKVGAMLLDLHNPTKILYRSAAPILEPEEWYENDWKPGVVYASGAVIFGDDLIVYYGGGDKYIAAAKINLKEFLRKLTSNQHTALRPA